MEDAGDGNRRSSKRPRTSVRVGEGLSPFEVQTTFTGEDNARENVAGDERLVDGGNCRKDIDDPIVCVLVMYIHSCVLMFQLKV